MPYVFPPELREFVETQMATGAYASEDDHIREALMALAERREVIDDVERAVADLEAGRGRPLEEVDADLRREYTIPHDA